MAGAVASARRSTAAWNSSPPTTTPIGCTARKRPRRASSARKAGTPHRPAARRRPPAAWPRAPPAPRRAARHGPRSAAPAAAAAAPIATAGSCAAPDAVPVSPHASSTKVLPTAPGTTTASPWARSSAFSARQPVQCDGNIQRSPKPPRSRHRLRDDALVRARQVEAAHRGQQRDVGHQASRLVQHVDDAGVRAGGEHDQPLAAQVHRDEAFVVQPFVGLPGRVVVRRARPGRAGRPRSASRAGSRR